MSPMILRPAAFVLALVFAWAGVAKLIRWRTWRVGLRRYRLGSWERAASVGVPAVELAVLAGLMAGRSRAAAALTLAMLSGFCLALLRARSAEGDRLPCNCFGTHSVFDYRTLLLRNGLLGVPAAVILIADKDFSLFDDLSLPTAGEALPAALVAIGVLFVAWTVRVVFLLSGGGEK
jgi:methylamine utilization protein MauE